VRAKRKDKAGAVGGIEPKDADWLKKWDEFNIFIAKRIGQTAREKLAWAVHAVQQRPGDLLPGDWDSLRTELAGFVTQRLVDQFHSSIAMWSEDEGFDRPSQEEAKAMLTKMGAMIEAAIKRQPVPIAKVGGTLVLVSSGFAGKEPTWHRSWGGVNFGWPDRAALALGDLIEKEGSLLKECPAPAIRAKEGETCGEWFVATRPRQEYCSGTCQSRASTRANRAGTETPAAKQRKARKEG
jgi:hypothetical protein